MPQTKQRKKPKKNNKRHVDGFFSQRMIASIDERITAERHDAAATALKVALVVLNNEAEMGIVRLTRIAQAINEGLFEYYDQDRLVAEDHLRRRLGQIGFKIDKQGLPTTYLDQNGRAVHKRLIERYEQLKQEGGEQSDDQQGSAGQGPAEA